MENTMINSQSAAAVNSAVSKIFSNKSVLDLAVLAYKRMAKSPNGCSDKISVVVGDGYRVTMDCGMDENECRLVLNIYLEEKNGNRYVRMREYHSGWADMGTEYMSCGSWKSVVVYAIKDAIESMVSKILDNYIKDGDKYSIALWEDMTGMIYMAPSLEEAPALEEAPVLDEVKILEDFCTNEASKIIAAGLTSVALANKEFYMYDYEYLYDYLIEAGFDADRAYEIRGQYDEEVDRAIRSLLINPDFVPVEVSDSDIESTERFWDNITMPYSAMGLAYVKENTSDVFMTDIIRAVAEEHWNFESVVKESQWTRFTNDSFRDLIWSTCWNEYLVEHTDGALEAETRYVMDFDSVYDDLFDELWPYMSTYDDSCGGCELWVNEWDVVERAAEIIENIATNYVHTKCIYWDEFPDYIMTAFLEDDLYGFDTFTERVMSELDGGDIVDIMPYDDGIHFSFVNDEAEVAA